MGSLLELLKLTLPSKTHFLLMWTSPVTVSLWHLTKLGMPFLVAASNCPTSLYFLLSRLTIGATLQAGFNIGLKSAVITYASLRRRRRSSHFLTGANLVRGTQIAVEPGKHSIAAPMAVSS